MTGLDHILWAAPDLGAGEKIIGSLTGVAPARGGSHPGFGTRNSLMGLDSGIYLEIISPDPAQALEGNRGGRIAALPRPGVMTFAIRSDDLDTLSAAARREGLSVQGPVAMSRDRPDGVRLDWTILYLEDSRFGEAIPFVIDWGQSPHPSESVPAGCRLRSFGVLHPKADELARLYAALDIPIPVKRGAYPGFVAELATPNGDVVLTHS
ncbi:MAG TPA: VOC family protein [Roseiarcus sp.]